MRRRPPGWLRPLGWAFAAVAGARNFWYDAGWAPVTRIAAPVVSVGNLTVGGTGKTPLVALLAGHLATAGRRPAVVSRGHGGRNARRRDGGPLVVSRGDGSPVASPADAGDEPVLLASLLPGVPVVVGRDRVAAAGAAVDRLGADLVVLDDGFQHRRLHRDADLVTLDATIDPDREALLPAGRSREPARGLRRAHAVVVTRADDEDRFRRRRDRLRDRFPELPVFRARHRPVGLRLLVPAGEAAPAWRLSDLRDLPVSAFAGLASPRAFEHTLTGLGARVVRFDDRPDHHAYRAGEIADLVRAGRRAGARLALTTAKDAVRVPPGEDVDGLAVVDIVLEVENLRELLDLVQALCLPARRRVEAASS